MQAKDTDINYILDNRGSLNQYGKARLKTSLVIENRMDNALNGIISVCKKCGGLESTQDLINNTVLSLAGSTEYDIIKTMPNFSSIDELNQHCLRSYIISLRNTMNGEEDLVNHACCFIKPEYRSEENILKVKEYIKTKAEIYLHYFMQQKFPQQNREESKEEEKQKLILSSSSIFSQPQEVMAKREISSKKF